MLATRGALESTAGEVMCDVRQSRDGRGKGLLGTRVLAPAARLASRRVWRVGADNINR